MSIEEEREFCRKVYEKWDFIKRIVELYAEGVSWQGCDKLEIESIKNGVKGMLVSGTGQFTLKTEERIGVLMPPRFYFEGEEPGHPFLWPMTQNAAHLDRLLDSLISNVNAQEMFSYLAKDICLGLGVPYDLLGSLANTANGDAIMWGLITFIGHVNQWREYLGYKLDVTWNEIWHTNGIVAYGQVYQVFRAQGIDLMTLREETLNAAKFMKENRLISNQTYNKLINKF